MAAPGCPAMFRDQFDQAGVLERFVNVVFALEALGKNRIGFDFGVRDNQRHRLVGEQICSSERGGGAPVGDPALDAVMVQLLAHPNGRSAAIVYWSHLSPTSTVDRHDSQCHSTIPHASPFPQ